MCCVKIACFSSHFSPNAVGVDIYSTIIGWCRERKRDSYVIYNTNITFNGCSLTLLVLSVDWLCVVQSVACIDCVGSAYIFQMYSSRVVHLKCQYVHIFIVGSPNEKCELTIYFIRVQSAFRRNIFTHEHSTYYYYVICTILSSRLYRAWSMRVLMVFGICCIWLSGFLCIFSVSHLQYFVHQRIYDFELIAVKCCVFVFFGECWDHLFQTKLSAKRNVADTNTA